MAQSGMFVPAKVFKYSPYTSLFARITGNDNIFKGLSSFMLEMTELKAILRRSGGKTLVIGDEVCRGTESVSGTAIVASALIKLTKTDSSFIFATHLHQIPQIEEIKQLNHVKCYHLTVEHDVKKDILIFDRKLKEGSGEPIYGVTIAKYVIDDEEFIRVATKIRNNLTGISNDIIVNKTSKYNSDVYLDHCGVCGESFKENSKSVGGYIDTHHINHQKDCSNGFVIDKPHVPMNIMANLVPLCIKCHNDVHHNKLIINGYKQTSNGVILDFIKRKVKTKVKTKIV